MAIAISSTATVESTVQALHAQTIDYLIHPSMNAKKNSRSLKTATDSSFGKTDGLQTCPTIIGTSPRCLEVFRELRRLASLEAAVFIHGESGTGKEVAARALHQLSGRKGPFIAVNCGAVDSETLSNQLFGQESKHGTTKQSANYFEQAEGGTLFLDEIVEMPLPLQKRLLTVLETGAIEHDGGESKQPINVHIVAATNRERRTAATRELFQQDLYRRLMDCSLYMPPLRERSADIMLLAQHFLDSLNAQNKTALSFASDTKTKLLAYSWPGNIRELKNIIERAFVLAQDQVSIELPSNSSLQEPALPGPTLHFHIGMSFEKMERDMLLNTLAYFNNDKPKAAQVLGISLKTVYNHLARLTETKSAQSKYNASESLVKEAL